MGELVKALEEPARRRGSADAIALFCRTAKFDFQEHLSSFITVRTPCLGTAANARAAPAALQAAV